MPSPSGTSKAEKFHRLQLRSCLGECPAWRRLLQGGLVQSQAQVQIDLALPSSAEAEAHLLAGVESLGAAMGSKSLGSFYKSFGWSDAKQYFASMGETQVMLVDVDHNDSDDRLAIVILAFQVASASLERGSKQTLLLDARTYESKGLTLWRTLQLAARLTACLPVQVLPVFSDTATAVQLIADYLKVPPTAAALNSVSPGAGDLLPRVQRDLRSLEGLVTVWILSGLCKQQVDDIQHCRPRVDFRFIEQAQPAWQSMELEADAAIQPDWSFPPPFGDEKGFGCEPSNVRSSEASYPETLMNYLRFQQVVAGTTYVCPALARSSGVLPGPVGRAMLKLAGRPINVVPGKSYVIKKAVELQRAEKAFGALLEKAKAFYEPLARELAMDANDDLGGERPELAAVVKYGTFLADAIAVCLCARPAPSAPRTTAVLRNLALAVVPRPGEDPVMTFQV